LHDLFILEYDGALLLDCEAARADELIRRLTAYKLRAEVAFENLRDQYNVWAIWNGPCAWPLSFADPRLPQLGSRLLIEKNKQISDAQISDFDAYDIWRMKLGVADGSRDLEIEKSTLVEGNIDILNGVDWKKGCYIGQELTARMHYRGLAKKRMFPVTIGGALSSGAAVELEGSEVGVVRSQNGAYGLALLSIDAVQSSLASNKPLTHGATVLTPFVPPWLKTEMKLKPAT